MFSHLLSRDKKNLFLYGYRQFDRVSPISNEEGESKEDEGRVKYRVGDLIGDKKYKVDGYIASGAFGSVLACTDVVTGKGVAIKILRSTPSLIEDAKYESKILKSLQKFYNKKRSHPFLLLKFLSEFEDTNSHHKNNE